MRQLITNSPQKINIFKTEKKKGNYWQPKMTLRFECSDDGCALLTCRALKACCKRISNVSKLNRHAEWKGQEIATGDAHQWAPPGQRHPLNSQRPLPPRALFILFSFCNIACSVTE